MLGKEYAQCFPYMKVMRMLNLSQDAANNMSLASNVMLIFGAILALIGTFGAFWSSNVLSDYADERDKINQRLIAEANQKAAQANFKAAELEKDTSSIKLEAEKAKAESERLKLQLQKMQEIRKLTKQQAEAGASALRSGHFRGPNSLNVSVGSVADTESQMFAQDIMQMIIAGGVSYLPTPMGTLPREIVQTGPSDTGISLTVSPNDNDVILQGAILLQNALHAAGLYMDVQKNPNMLSRHIQINILKKPII